MAARLAKDRRQILPPSDQIFAALAACPPDAVKAVILGQDPYPTPGHAHGLAFSVAPDVALPRSLSNIFKEMEDDIGVAPRNGNLLHWAHQGVLLLNTALTVPAKEAGGHAKIGWTTLVDDVITRLDDRPRAFVLWGKPAQARGAVLTHPDHLVLHSAHPSPLSAYRGFFGSRPFSRVNEWLKAKGAEPIDWTGP